MTPDMYDRNDPDEIAAHTVPCDHPPCCVAGTHLTDEASWALYDAWEERTRRERELRYRRAGQPTDTVEYVQQVRRRLNRADG